MVAINSIWNFPPALEPGWLQRASCLYLALSERILQGNPTLLDAQSILDLLPLVLQIMVHLFGLLQVSEVSIRNHYFLHAHHPVTSLLLDLIDDIVNFQILNLQALPIVKEVIAEVLYLCQDQLLKLSDYLSYWMAGDVQAEFYFFEQLLVVGKMLVWIRGGLLSSSL